MSESTSLMPGRQPAFETRATATFIARWWPELAVLTALSLFCLAFARMPVTLDVAWQLWIARQLLGGSALYSQIMEVNPPLWYWMAIPVQLTAEALSMRPATVMVVATCGGAALSLLLMAAQLWTRPAFERAIWLGTAFLVLAVMPLPDFAQREHLLLICALPYVLLIAHRAEGRDVPLSLALVIGLFAAPGFALKHYFVAAPVMLELWLIWRLGREWRPLRGETLGIGALAIAYALAVLLFTPAFLTEMLPLVEAGYEGYQVAFIKLFDNGFVLLWLLACYVLWKHREALPSFAGALCVAGLAFALSYLAQQKGWRYHAIAANGAFVLALASVLASGAWRGFATGMRACFVAALMIPFIPVVLTGPYQNLYQPLVRVLLKNEAPGTPVAILSTHPSTLWPMVDDLRLAYTQRYFGYWMVPHIERSSREGTLSRESALLADRVRAETVEDFTCNPPEAILVDDMSLSPLGQVDMLAFFKESRDFTALMAHYEPERTLAIYTLWRKKQEWQPPRPSNCRTIH